MPRSVLQEYGIEEEMLRLIPYGNGLINNTWKIEVPGREYILQKINQAVFREPGLIAANIRSIADYLAEHHPGYQFVSPVQSNSGNEMTTGTGSALFRLFPFVADSHTVDVVSSSDQAYEAASQFGKFTKLLSGFDARKLRITVPHFHDLAFRYEQFQHALQNGNSRRIFQSEDLIRHLLRQKDIVAEYKKITTNPEFRIRVTHHDTKISNVLFDEKENGICVIDLDTVMPGYFISDVGDMMRTYLSPVSEEEQDFDKIEVRPEFYRAIVDGYFDQMEDELTETEKKYFSYAGKFMIYMQAIRFLTDHLMDDVYYKVSYKGQNYARAGNQAVLLQRLVDSGL
ncbi:MAG: aminoglycoside phosphotransferase family protein [Chitinophagaceae bacterium]|nr:MAG: aminoglycoside phosphotransferase family protein [Chitinophagaceae bacterium]